MPNTLFKKAIVSGEPGTAGTPAIPGRPAVPARWEKIVDSSGAARQSALNLLTAQLSSGFITQEQYVASLDNLPPQTITTLVFVPGTPEVPPVPGTPGTESTLVTDLNIGWNSGARSVQEEKAGCEVEFTFSQDTVGAAAGFNNKADEAATIEEIGWGFQFLAGDVRVVEAGTFISITPSSVSEGAVFKIIRDADGVVTYFIDAALVYTSLKKAHGTIFLDGVIYSADGV